MKKFVLSIVIVMCAWCIARPTYAKDYHVYNLHGLVVSASDGSPVEVAAVQLFKMISPEGKKGIVTDSSMVTGVQADLNGEYWITSVPAGEYKVWVSSIGFKPASRKISVSDNMTIPTFRLQEDIALLQEVQVKGHAAEMTVKGDTIEYNTAAYHVNENAMVEDLLKKMNGVEVDKEGKVTINGEEIKGVRIDGKKFFGDDVQSATKNIPAEMIEKIQVIDEKSDMAKLTGFEDDDTERIINLTLKADRKKGVFGNYNGGLGADIFPVGDRWRAEDDLRYSAGVFTNTLSGESQTTVIGSANNTNEVRTGRGRGMWGGQNAGITRNENIGVNTNVDFTDRLDKRDDETEMLFGGDVSFNHSFNDTRSQVNKESYSGDITYNNNDSTSKISHSWDVNARFELEYQIDTLDKIILRPQLSYTNNNSVSEEDYTYLRDSSQIGSDTINIGRQDKSSRSEDINAKLQVIYNHKFLKPGRSVTLRGNIDFTNSKGNSSTLAQDLLADTTKVNQNTDNRSNSINVRLRSSWVEPIAGRNHFLETAVMFGTNYRKSNKDQYDFSSIDSTYHPNDEYSNRLENLFIQESVSLSYRYIRPNIDLTVGAQFNPSQTITKTYYGGQLSRDTTIYAWNWSPTMRFKYNFGKKEFARIHYRGRNSQPSIQQMEPVRNNSNAMNETVGNLGLKPAFAHNLHAMYSKFDQDKFWSLMAGLHATVTQDALVNNSIYDQTGKLYQQTVNAQGTPWNLSGDLMFNTPLANKLLQLNMRTSLGYNQRLTYISREQDAATIERLIAQSSSDFPLGEESKTGNLSVRQNLTLRITHDIVDFGVTGSVAYTRTTNSLNSHSLSNVVDWTVTGDILFHLPKSWSISADCGYTARYGYAGLNDVNEILLNAGIDKTWGNATLSLKGFDLLHQKKNIVQTVGENYVSYQKCNTLPTYVMLTFTYKFNKMGDLKATGNAAYMQEMIESGADPSKGKMPAGPPPFMR
ncbi:MAG: outer membrane beta-barrel protein [Paludibacteraceae bacterium]|nr:outer membrane beta-barrel protein [Paludibacteraceae bacterium]